MQVLRLVQTGWVDKVIAFDELPKRLLNGVEMRAPDGLPRHWKTFLGQSERLTPDTAEINPITRQELKIPGVKEVGPFFYVLYYREINKDMERWQEISGFVRRVVSLQFRLLDKLEDMALPLSTDAAGELKLEPEDLETRGALIPIPLEFQEKAPAILDQSGAEVKAAPAVAPEPVAAFKCPSCEKAFDNDRALRMHTYKKHPDAKAAKKEEAAV